LLTALHAAGNATHSRYTSEALECFAAVGGRNELVLPAREGQAVHLLHEPRVFDDQDAHGILQRLVYRLTCRVAVDALLGLVC